MHAGSGGEECNRCMLAVGTQSHTLLFELSSFSHTPPTPPPAPPTEGALGSTSAEEAAGSNTDNKNSSRNNENNENEMRYGHCVHLVGVIPSPDRRVCVTALAWLPEALNCAMNSSDNGGSAPGTHGVNVGVNIGSAESRGLVLAVRSTSPCF